MRWAVMASAVAGLAPRAWAVPDTQPAPLAPQQDPQHYLDWLRATLRTGTQPLRNEAARRLIEIGTAEARDAIRAGLAGNDERSQYACANAVADVGTPDPQWRDVLLTLLQRDHPPAEPAARALARYDVDPQAYTALIKAAGDRQRATRLTAVGALGQITQKPVAETLVALVLDPDAATRAAAAEALIHLSGHREFDRDAHRWRQWLDGLQTRNPADWRAQVLGEQHAHLEHDEDLTHEQVRQLKAKFQELAFEDFERQPEAAKPAKLLSHLNDSDASERETGAWIVSQAVAGGTPMGDDVRKRLIELVGDSSVDVRLQVAQSLAKLSDPGALDAILTQLQLEKDAQVKVALIQAVARIGNARALPVLQQLLNDGSADVVAAAAGAVKALAPVIRKAPIQTNQVFQEIRQVLVQRTGPPGQPNSDPNSEDLRVALIGALASFGAATDQTATDLFSKFLSQSESPRVRVAALYGLGELGDAAGAGEFIARELDPNLEPDPAVRAAAAVGLGQVGNITYASRLYDSTHRQFESDPQVQKAAWTAFQNLLPHGTLNDLSYWADRIHQQKELDREAVVLTALAAKLKDADDRKNLAIEQQRLGAVYRELNKPELAVPYFKSALDYWQTQRVQRQNIVGLVGELIRAYLASAQYHDAVQFGQQEITIDRSYQDEVGPAIRDEAERLIHRGDKTSYGNAALLIREALQITPPPRVAPELEDLNDRIPAEYRGAQP